METGNDAETTRRIDALLPYKLNDPSTQVVFNDVLTLAAQLTGAPVTFVAFEGREKIEARAAYGAEAGNITVSQSLFDTAVNSSELFRIADFQESKFRAEDLTIEGHSVRSFVALPIQSLEGRPLGMLGIAGAGQAQLMNLDSQSLLSLSRICASVLHSRKCSLELQQVTTERDWLEDLLNDTENSYRALMEKSTDASIIASEGRVALINNTALKLLRAENIQSVLIKPIESLLSVDSKEAFMSCHARLMEDQSVPVFEAKFVTFDGEEVETEVASVPFLYHGKPGAQFVIRDISERKRRERRMAAQYSATRVLAAAESFQEAAPEILEGICRSLGWDLGQFWMIAPKTQTLKLIELWHANDELVSEFEAVSRRTSFAPGVGLPGRVWVSRQPAWIEDVVKDTNFPRAPYAEKVGLHGAFAFPLMLGKEFLGTMEFFSREIRQPDQELLQMFASIGSQIGQYIFRKDAESSRAQLLQELAHANQELKDFAYIVSHDLKAPLRAIGSLASWLATDYSDKLDDDGKEQLQLLVGRVKRMHALIDGILQYSRVAKQDVSFSDVDLQELVAEVIESLAAPSHIRISIKNPLPVVSADPTRMQQVFQNLISNAIKYMDKPEGVIEVDCAREDGFWKFSISDNGPGIEQKYFDRIFQLFQTLAPRDEVESTGVGLAVVKKIVELYGGRIQVQSSVGQGSIFSFTFPVKKEQEASL